MKMFAKVACVILIGVSLAVADVPSPIKASQNLLNIMTAHQFTEQPVGRSTDSYYCFNYYIPILNQITNKYESDYNVCEDDATRSRQKIDQDTQSKRKELEKASDQTFYNLSPCQSLESAEKYFECYRDNAALNSKVMYNISTSAEDALLEVREAVRLVIITEDGCKATADRTYVENTSKTHESLTNCLNGVDQTKQQ